MARGNVLMDLVVFSIAALAFYFIVWKNPKFQEWIKSANLGGGTTGGGSAGSTAVGKHVYATAAGTCGGNIHTQDIGCSGGSSASQRGDHENCKLFNHEATGILQFGGGCGCGDEATVKHYGPTHQDGNCCWALAGIEQNGDISFGGEGPHPETVKDDKQGVIKANVGDVTGKKVGIKGVVWDKGGGTFHQEFWVDVTGTGESWEKVAERDMTEWGHEEKTSTPAASDQQVEFRCDCSEAKWEATEVIEIAMPPTPASGGTSTTPAGGTTTTTTEPAEEANMAFAMQARAYASRYNNPDPEKLKTYSQRDLQIIYGGLSKHSTRENYDIPNQNDVPVAYYSNLSTPQEQSWYDQTVAMNARRGVKPLTVGKINVAFR